MNPEPEQAPPVDEEKAATIEELLFAILCETKRNREATEALVAAFSAGMTDEEEPTIATLGGKPVVLETHPLTK